jgi:hypothetical protein
VGFRELVWYLFILTSELRKGEKGEQERREERGMEYGNEKGLINFNPDICPGVRGCASRTQSSKLN